MQTSAIELKRALGKKIKQLRLIRGWRREDLADRLDVSIQSLQRLEAGANFISAELLSNISDVFSVTPSYLFNSLEVPESDKMSYISQILQNFSSDELSVVVDLLHSFERHFHEPKTSSRSD